MFTNKRKSEIFKTFDIVCFVLFLIIFVVMSCAKGLCDLTFVGFMGTFFFGIMLIKDFKVSR